MTEPAKTPAATKAPAPQGTVAGTATQYEPGQGSTVAPGNVEELTMANDLGKMVVIHR